MADYSAHKTTVGDVNYITKINAHMDDTQDIATEVESARVGLATLKAQIDNAIATTAEVQTARDGLASLVAQIDDLQARMADLETGVVGGTYSYDPDRVIDANGFRQNALELVFASGAFVDCFFYDTTRDSDAGAWRKRCAATSWYNETLNTATRGATRPFPARALLVLTTSSLSIYDADDPALPLWRVTNALGPSGVSFWRNASILATAVRAVEGKVYFGLDSGGSSVNNGLCIIDFAGDVLTRYSSTANTGGTGLSVSADASATAVFPATFATEVLVDNEVNAVAARVVSGAPTDDLTQLKVPTVIVATDGGISVLKDDGNIWDITGQPGAMVISEISNDEIISGWSYSGHIGIFAVPSSDISYTAEARDYYASASSVPALLLESSDITAIASFADFIFAANYLGMNIIKDDVSNQLLSSVAYITADWATGWLRGDIHCCVLADTTVEVLTDADTISDRSAKQLSIPVPASQTVTKTAVAAGSELVWYNATADLTLTLGATITSTGELTWWEEVSGVPVCYCYDFTGSQGYINGVPGTVSTNVAVSGTTLTIKAGAKLALVRATATATSISELKRRFLDELRMFYAAAAVTVAGTVSNILSVAVDPEGGAMQLHTSYGRSEFHGLIRVASEATAIGVPAAVSVVDGRVLQAGSTAARLDTVSERL